METPGWKIRRFFEESYDALPSAKGGFGIPSMGVEILLDLKMPWL